MEQQLFSRAEQQCELTKTSDSLTVLDLSPDGNSKDADEWLVLTEQCRDNLDTPANIDVNVWRSLGDSMWSSVPAVQVASYRVLTLLSREGEAWATELLETMYLDEETLAWAEAGLPSQDDSNSIPVDSNGTPLTAGDTVTLIKDLTVKGANFTAKRGTTVKNISLSDDVKHIEGKINGQRIVIVAEYTKKA